MPRRPRIDFPGLIHHVFNRGIQRLPLFHDDEDRLEFMDWLGETRRRYGFELHQYALMTNHFHLLIKTAEAPIGRIMQYFASRFSGWFNRKYRHSGHLFQSRFGSLPVQQDHYYRTVCRYIHLNPVRAKMVARPEDYRWSNYRSVVEGLAEGLADPTYLLEYFGADPSEQRIRYRAFVEEAIAQPEPITHEILGRMRSWGKIIIPERFALSQQPQ